MSHPPEYEPPDVDLQASLRHYLAEWHANADPDAWDDEHGQSDEQRAAAEDAAVNIVAIVEALDLASIPIDALRRIVTLLVPPEHRWMREAVGRVYTDLDAIHRWLSPDQTPGGIAHQVSQAEDRKWNLVAEGTITESELARIWNTRKP